MADLLRNGLSLSASLPQRPDGYILLAIYALLWITAFLSSLRTFRGLGRLRWFLFIFLTLIGIPLNVLLLVPVSSVVPPAVSQAAQTLPAMPLLGLLCVLLVGVWVGLGPALLTGLLTGAARWLLAGGRFTAPFEIALFAALAAFLTQQDYRGWLARWLRRPFAAGLVAALAMLVNLPLALFVTAPGGEMASVDFTLSVLAIAAVFVLGEAAINGLLAQLASQAFPALRKPLTGSEPPFYARSLSRRLLLTILPITSITITVQVVVVGFTALDEANRQTVAQLSRNAQAAADLLDSFFVDGQAILAQFAQDERLQAADAAVRQSQLESVRDTVAFFDEILLADSDAQVVAAARGGATDSAVVALTDEEAARVGRALQSGAPQRTGVHKDAAGETLLSFIQPLRTGDSPTGALIGRARWASNPRIQVMKRSLADTQDLGVGYLIDDNSRIVVHPDASQELTQWILNETQPALAATGGGRAYIDTYPSDNTRRVVFVQDVSGTPWRVAIELPYANILRAAAQISAPLVLLFAVIMIGAFILLPLISRRITQPLGRLAQAASRITQGELERPIAQMGDDETGRLSAEFERMRLSLKARMDELSLLLRVSQSVAASLDLERGIPPILDAAVQATAQQADSPAARTARVVAFDEAGRPARVIACGDGPPHLTPLDEALAAVTVRDERPLEIENVARSRGAIDPNLVGPGVRSISALPLRRSDRPLGVMWLGFPEPRHFGEAERGLLATLAGQAAVFLENVGLFVAAETGHQRLQAVLSSTNDAVLVTDRENRILLCNPAAEIAFGLPRGEAVGRAVSDVVDDSIVVGLLTEHGDPVVRTAEVLLPDGRTLYASASSIASGDGVRIGRVAVLRDITHLKELDSMKSEFVNTVSHDLRSPLTYMRGYVTMIPMIGSLASKQQEYLDKIMGGIEQMTALIDDLLDLGRIEAGVGLVREEVSMADVARDAIESMQSHAITRQTALDLDSVAPGRLHGDRQLLKHAVANLIDNAIKYTPSGGWVKVGIEERDGWVIVRVTDNGIGIATADQPRLFEKFYRIKRRDTLDVKGTGLGLAIVKSIAEWHQGRVWVESQVGRGSTFYIALPADGG